MAQKLLGWVPDRATVYADLTIGPSLDVDRLTIWQGHELIPGETSWWSGSANAQATSIHWEIPLMAVGTYMVMIPLLKWYIAKYGKWDVKEFAFYWNSFLSIFSWCGVFACVPVMVSSLVEKGLYFSSCAPAHSYSNGLCGFFVSMFVYSKVFELVDTVLLLLANKPVIALQWWHHSTVLLYCWHSNSASIATGLWFASMNYSVHSIMYAYFAATATTYRKLVTPFAIFITLAQLLQMAVGMFVTVKAVFYQADGLECHVNKTNSVLGLSMYFSYFVLFLKLFIDNYVMKKKQGDALTPNQMAVQPSLVRSTTEEVIRDLTPNSRWSTSSDEDAKKVSKEPEQPSRSTRGQRICSAVLLGQARSRFTLQNPQEKKKDM